MIFNTVKCEMLEPYSVVKRVMGVLEYEFDKDNTVYNVTIRKVIENGSKQYIISCTMWHNTAISVTITQMLDNGKSMVAVCTRCDEYDTYTDLQKAKVTVFIKQILIPAINEHLTMYIKFMSATKSSEYRVAKRRDASLV